MEKQKYWIVADCETSEWNNEMKTGDTLKLHLICYIVYNQDNIEVMRGFTLTSEEFFHEIIRIKSMLKLKNSIRCYFHNLRFDVKFMLNYAKSEGYQTSIIFRQSSVLKASIRNRLGTKNEGIVEFRDSMSILLASIEKLGDSIKFQKLSRPSKDEWEKYLAYCYVDCEIMAKSLIMFTEFANSEGFDLTTSNLKLTLASHAFRLVFIKNFDLKEEQIIEKDKRINAYARDFYFGGICECYNLNKFGKTTLRDFNSLYPSIMIENLFPEAPYEIFDLSEKDFTLSDVFREFARDYDRIFAFEIDIDERNQEIPIFPERIEISQNNKRTMFRAVRKRHLIFRQELDYCLTENIPLGKVYKIIVCKGYMNLFGYMKEIYAKRKKFEAEDNPMFAYLCKIFMNSTYGKFAERPIRNETKLVVINDIDEVVPLEEDGWIRDSDIDENGGYTVFVKNKECSDKELRTNVLIACLITALARLKTISTLRITKNPIYTDTDSIIDEGKYNSSDKIGELKVEMDLEEFWCCAPKVYEKEFISLEKKTKGKLLKHVKGKGFTKAKSLRQIVDTSIDNIYVRPSGIKESIRRHIDFESVVSTNKHLENIFIKRKLNEDFTTRAWNETEFPCEFEAINKVNYTNLLNKIKMEVG